MKLFVSPHNDDAVLFGSFTLTRERPKVLTVFDSYVQAERGFPSCRRELRREEDVRAVTKILECRLHFGAIPDNLPEETAAPMVRALLSQWRRITDVWLPEVEVGGHAQHNLVGRIGLEVFEALPGVAVRRYLTYTAAGKSRRNGVPVPATGPMVRKKLEALSCYRSQIETEALGCVAHFLRDQFEYTAN